MGKSEDPKEQVAEQPKDPKDYFQFEEDGVVKDEVKDESKPEEKPNEAEAVEEKSEETETEVKPDNAETDIPDRFVVKNEDGSINWAETAKKAGKSWSEGEKMRGRQGQMLGDLKKDREEWQRKYELLYEAKAAQEPTEELTEEKVIEWLEKNPKKLVEGITSEVISNLTKKNVEKERQRIKDTQIFQNEVLQYLDAHPEIEKHYEAMTEIFSSKSDSEKFKLMNDVPMMMDSLLKDVRIRELEELSKKAAYDPKPPKDEGKSVAGAGKNNVDKLKAAGLTEEEIAFGKGFGMTDDQILNTIKRR